MDDARYLMEVGRLREWIDMAHRAFHAGDMKAHHEAWVRAKEIIVLLEHAEASDPQRPPHYAI